MQLESQGGGARAWRVPEQGVCGHFLNPRGLSAGEQPGQIHIFKRHLWWQCGEQTGKAGRQEAGRGARGGGGFSHLGMSR